MPSTHDSEHDERNDNLKIYVDGELLPKQDAKVSVYDSGFMMGDGVWEGMRLYKGKLAFVDEHLERLYESAYFLDIDIGVSRDEMKAILKLTLDANNMSDNAHVRLMVSRGRKTKPFQDPRLSQFGSTIVVIAEHSVVREDTANTGVTLATVPIVRGLPTTQDPKLNSHCKLNCIMALNHALKAGANEALMLDPHGFVNTSNSCNFFIVRKGEVWTSTGDYCMNGITRKKVIEVCEENGIPIRLKNYSLYETYSADEAFLTGTFGGQTPVIEIDGRKIGDGKPGPVMQKIRALYKQKIVDTATM
ncbi:MAG: aminotransferase class IV [Alteromonas sp.]|nr:aminotransferase class IV [Alteromonas sp.]